jgi:SET domain-containing protein
MPSRAFRIGRAKTGLGLFATKPIKRAAYIATYRGRRITTEEADRREALGARYMFELSKRWTIDGSPRWNVARYINHSCRPNAKPIGRNGGIVIVALRRIEPEEEITYDYGKEYLKFFLETGGCRCAACRRKAARRRRRQREARKSRTVRKPRKVRKSRAS